MPALVPGFNDETRQHSDSGAVQEIQLPQIEHDRRRGIDQCSLEHLENGRIILRPDKRNAPLKKTVLLFSSSRISNDSPWMFFTRILPRRFLRGKMALVVTVMTSRVLPGEPQIASRAVRRSR